MRKIELDGVTYHVPSGWEEVDPNRVPHLIELVYLTPESGKMIHALIVTALNIPPKKWKQLHKKHFSRKLSDGVRTANAAVLVEIMGYLNWMYTQPMEVQPFEFIQIGDDKCVLPEPGLITVGYGEFTDSYMHLEAFTRQLVPGDERLNYLVGTVCRPVRTAPGYMNDPGWNGDHRVPYNEFGVRARLKDIEAMTYADRLAVLLWITGQIKKVLGGYSLFDSSGSTDKNGGARAITEEYPGQGFVKNAHLMAEKGIFGTLKQTQESNLHEVLQFLQEHQADIQKQNDRDNAV